MPVFKKVHNLLVISAPDHHVDDDSSKGQRDALDQKMTGV